MQVVIVGGGIGGLTAALTLHQIGISCKVYESVRELKPLGVGINLQPYSVRELFQLGLEDQLREAGIPAKGLAYHTKRGQHVLTEKLGSEAGFDWPQFHMHRGALQMMLAKEVERRMGPGVLNLGHRFAEVEQSGERIKAKFVDRATGQTLEPVNADLLIGCDGVHSAVRHQFYPNEKAPHWNRVIMWRGVTEGVKLLDGQTMVFAGTFRQKFVAYQILKPKQERKPGEDGLMLNWLCELIAPEDAEFPSEDWNRQGRMEDFAPEFDDWIFPWVNIPDIVKRNAGIWEYPQVDRDPTPQWVFDRVALLGDAAHPLTPLGSNGASLAIFDARVLGRELAARPSDPKTALKAYEAERKPALEKILAGNRAGGPEHFMPLVEERAPNGFDDIRSVLSEEEMQIATNYRAITGLTKDMINDCRSLIPPEQFINGPRAS
ncbi:flavin-dependent oxidoreductase [Pusillimonas sp.]|uniref:flavin-dependent oxidoreductase n=1 Tax=Pusillimonas sp. TaxID=3040095 RepID=UPI0029A0C268|nr:flavin-dependent oxidoreductase [Pusillimonas sp.]MDX3894211.1 flavin-dependent oxidoreductase [Pusillimonas sp.]